MTTLPALIERLASATEAEQHAVILDALTYAHSEGWITAQQLHRAERQLREGAYFDAALILVPEDYDWIVARTNGGLTIHAQVGPDNKENFAEAPALALCIAALRARSALTE